MINLKYVSFSLRGRLMLEVGPISLCPVSEFWPLDSESSAEAKESSAEAKGCKIACNCNCNKNYR